MIGVGYTPRPSPEPSVVTTREAMEYLQRELAEISQAFTGISEGRAGPVLYGEPAKPREGMQVYADGTTWDPGSGEGPYSYNGSAWKPAFSHWTKVAGGISYTGNVTVVSGVFLAPDGSAAAPSYSFSSAGSSDNGMFLPAANSLGFATAGTEALRIDVSQNVGIGIAPSYQLDLYRSGSTNTTFVTRNATVSALLQVSGTAQVNVGALSNHPLVFLVNNAEVGRFDTAGVLTLTKTSAGALTSPLILKNNSASASTQVALDFMPHTSVTTGRIGNAYISGSQYDMIFSVYTATGLTEMVRIDGSGPLSLLKGQIKFPSTANLSTDAYTLDDYREGSWTPADASGAGLSLTVHSATYVRIGRTLFFHCYITFPATASGAQVNISGLPFNTASIDTAAVFSSATNAYTFIAQVINAGFQVYNQAGAAATNAHFSGHFLIINGFYRVA